MSRFSPFPQIIFCGAAAFSDGFFFLIGFWVSFGVVW
jgi:hypothetical protein